jgi:hypothetical protein
MREVVVMRWCDACHQEDAKTAATSAFTVGIVAGESRPALKLLELCERHEKLIVELQLLLSEVGQTPEVKPKAQAQEYLPTARDVLACPICGREMTKGGLVGHVWIQHAGTQRPEPPTICPDCRLSFSSASACGVHRRSAHRYDPLEDALVAVKGYKHG